MLGGSEGTEAHLKLVGHLLGRHCPAGAEEAIHASHGDDRSGGPNFRSAMTHETEAGGVSEQLPRGSAVGAADATRAPRGGQSGGAFARPSVVERRRPRAHSANIGEGGSAGGRPQLPARCP